MKLVTLNEREWLDANANAATNPPVLGTIVTANTVADQSASVATTVAGVVTDLNTLIANLKAAGVMS